VSTGRTERPDFQATSDPALRERETPLLGYHALYELWERQQWAVQDLDFSQDRIDWQERIPPDERYQRMYGLSAFFCGEQRVAAELGPIMRAVPDEDMRIFLCTQIADEARHVMFFDRFYSEVGVLEADTLQGRLEETSEHLNPEFGELFDELLHERVDRLAREPEDMETLVEAITIYHMVAEGMLALTGQHFIIDSRGLRPPTPDASRSVYPPVTPGRCRASSPASPWWRATSTAMSRSAPASYATWCAATSATRRRSSGRWWRSRPRPTACCGRSGSRAPTRRRPCSASRSRRPARSR
jgi:hypothetical protein